MMLSKLILLLSTTIFLPIVTCCQASEPQIPVQLAEVPFEPNGHPVDMVVNSTTEHVYITNEFGGYIGVFKGTEQVASLPSGGTDPNYLAIDESNGWVYAVNQYDNNVTVIQNDEVITTLEVAGRQPSGRAVEPQRGWAYVVSPYNAEPPFGEPPERGGHVTVLHGDEVIGTIYLGPISTIHIVADPVNGLVYAGSVGMTGGGQVFVIDGLEVINQFDVNLSIETMAVNPNNGDVYVLNSAADRNLSLFRNGEFVSAIGLDEDGQSIGGVRNLQVHPVTGDVYVVDFANWEVIVVRNMRVRGRVPVGSGALKMAIDPITSNVYVANFNEDSVTVINDTEVLVTLEVGWYPYGIGVNPVNGWLYVSNTNDDTVTIFGLPEETVQEP